ncbi:hypothetical protein [Nostoc sp.]|uniref:hypothetical protein n=1 Tax=Nostoc sp. TaxID=1180 RepID=UPI002FF91C4E
MLPTTGLFKHPLRKRSLRKCDGYARRRHRNNSNGAIAYIRICTFYSALFIFYPLSFSPLLQEVYCVTQNNG